MSYQNDIQHQTATSAVQALDALGIETSAAEEPMTRWNRVRDAVRNLQKPDATDLWQAIAADDQKKVTKAATDYMVSQAIKEAAKADTHREDTFRAETLSVVKRLVIDAQDEARNMFNAAAEEYTSAFAAADNHPDPSVLIVTEGGSKIWADLIQAAHDMSRAADVIKRGHEFGYRVNDEGSGLGAQVPYCTGLPTITAYGQAKAQHDWLMTPQHAPHREWGFYLLAGARLYAGDLTEQRAEVERLIGLAQDSRKMKMIPDMIADTEERALARAMKKAQKNGASK